MKYGKCYQYLQESFLEKCWLKSYFKKSMLSGAKFFIVKRSIAGKILGGCLQIWPKINQKMEKMGVGVENSGGKNPKYGKNLVVGEKSGGFWKMIIPSWNFFPTPPW